MNAEQHRRVRERYGYAFSGALSEYLVRLDNHRENNRLVALEPGPFYDFEFYYSTKKAIYFNGYYHNFSENRKHNHANDERELWRTLARVRELRQSALFGGLPLMRSAAPVSV